MDCEVPQTYEDAIRAIPNSVLPIQGLRRNDDGQLGDDALQIVVESLRARGMDAKQPEQRKVLMGELSRMICLITAQYAFLMNEFRKRLVAGGPITVQYLQPIRERNQTLMDLLTVSRHIHDEVVPYQTEMREGFQTQQQPTQKQSTGDSKGSPSMEELQHDKMVLYLDSALKMREHTLDVVTQQNRSAANSLGLYGFLNLVAIGLLIYLYRK